MSRLSRTLLVVALLATAAGAPSLTGAQTPQKPPAAAAPGMKSHADQMSAMDTQMKSMREMHEKMANAKSPEERNALMADNMKAMQGGMAAMGMMGGAGMAGMGGMGGMGAMGSMQGGKPMPGDMNQRQQMMEKRMEMMQSMMQMMMDRMPATPQK